MPSASAAWRAANSKVLTSRGSAPNCARLSFAWSELDPDADKRLRSLAGTPSVAVARTILSSSSMGVEAEGPDAMLEIGLGDRFLGFHRVHEALHRLGQELVDQPDLADRGDVVMGNARFPEDPQQVGRRVRLHRVKRPAREFLDEKTSGSPRGMRTQKCHRLNRAQLGDSGTPPDTGRGGG